jgi:hypothetical protein
MDTQTLVDDKIHAGLRFITLLVRNNFDVKVACWVKTSEEDDWFLYVASGEVDKKGLAEAYREAYRALEVLDTPWITASQLKLVRSDDPIVADVKETQHLLTAAFPTISHRPQLGDLSTQEVYIYPNLEPDKVLLRQVFSITYVRQENTNIWNATTRPGGFHRGVRAKGAVSYTTASYEGEKPEEQRFAIVSVLVEIDPKFDERAFLERPDTRRMLADQARRMADELFTSKHPEAIIQPDVDHV